MRIHQIALGLGLVVGPLVFGGTPPAVTAQGANPSAPAAQGPGAQAPWPQGQQAPPRAIPDQYIVVLRDDVADPRPVASEHAQRHGLTTSHVYEHALKGYAATIPSQRLAAVRSDPRVLFVSEDREVQAAGMVTLASGDAAPPGIRRIDASTGTGPDAKVHEASTASVAVLDTGIDLSHPDLNAVNGKNCVSVSRTAQDDNGHGTHVSGTISGKNNGAGVVGVAPGTRLYAVKVLNFFGTGSFSQFICGIDWVTANTAALNIKVANMSLGGAGANDNNCGNTNSDALHRAICRSTNAGLTYAVAAMNNATNFASTVPAVYPEVLTVTAMVDSDGAPGGTGGGPSCYPSAPDDAYANFSNYAVASTEINHTIAAPGGCIYSTARGGGYTTMSGTSQATPHVSGAVALCLGNGSGPGPCAGLPPAQIIQKMRGDAQTHATDANGFLGDPRHVLSGKYFGYLLSAGGY